MSLSPNCRDDRHRPSICPTRTWVQSHSSSTRVSWDRAFGEIPSMHVAVTGASSGIGEAIAREYLRAGASVTLVARRLEMLETIAKEAGGRTLCVKADLSVPEEATAWLERSQRELGPID